MTALYTLAAEYRHTADTLADMDLPMETIENSLAAIEGEVEAKATNVAMMVRNLEAMAESIKAAEVCMAARRKALEARAEHIRSYLFTNMLNCGMTRIESPWFVLAIQDNPPAVSVTDESLLPEAFWKQPPPVVDKLAIKAAIKAGDSVPGATLSQSKRIVIK